jgi:hypothetical protein
MKAQTNDTESAENTIETSNGQLACKHLKDGVTVEYTLNLATLKAELIKDENVFQSAMFWMNQAVISRGGGRWRDFTVSPDGTAAMLAVLKSTGDKATKADKAKATDAMKSFAHAPEAFKAQYLRNNGMEYVNDFDTLALRYMARRIKEANSL